jgi:hypothetical protein
MATTHASLTLDQEALEQAQGRYREFGFDDVGELVSTAIKAYLKRRELDEKLAAMRRAARDPQYLAVLREISEDFKYVDGENLPPEY